jgi:hypothetical protein
MWSDPPEEDFQLTNPVPVGGRESRDHYPTPRWATLALLRHSGRWFPPGESMFLDPACGEGAILQAIEDEVPNASTRGIELDEGRVKDAERRRLEVVQGDGLDRELWGSPDWIIGNPPYSLALEFAFKAAEWAKEEPHRTAALLLRLSFLEPASGRAVLFQRHRPDVFILPRRPLFDGRGTDNITSAWFCWPGTGHLDWLPP